MYYFIIDCCFVAGFGLVFVCVVGFDCGLVLVFLFGM